MAKNIADTEIRNTETDVYQITHESDLKATYVYVNGLDADLNITVEATYAEDSNFDNAVELLTDKIVGAGETAYDTSEYPWDRIRFLVTADTTPTSGRLQIKKMV